MVCSIMKSGTRSSIMQYTVEYFFYRIKYWYLSSISMVAVVCC